MTRTAPTVLYTYIILYYIYIIYCLSVCSQERQISIVRELLNDKNRTTLLDDKDRERLAFLSNDYLPSPAETSLKRSLLYSCISLECYHRPGQTPGILYDPTD